MHRAEGGMIVDGTGDDRLDRMYEQVKGGINSAAVHKAALQRRCVDNDRRRAKLFGYTRHQGGSA